MGRKKNRHHRFSPSNRIRNTQRMTIGSGFSSVLLGYLAVSARNFQLGRHHFVGARPFICIINVPFLGGGKRTTNKNSRPRSIQSNSPFRSIVLANRQIVAHFFLRIRVPAPPYSGVFRTIFSNHPSRCLLVKIGVPPCQSSRRLLRDRNELSDSLRFSPDVLILYAGAHRQGACTWARDRPSVKRPLSLLLSCLCV